MSSPGRRRVNFISSAEEQYIRLLLDDAHPQNKKNGLQRLCKFYREKEKLKNPHPFRQILNGLLYVKDSKVLRWTLNTLALVGKVDHNFEPIIEAIDRNISNPEVLVAGIAALFAISPPQEVLKTLSSRPLPLEGAYLVAAHLHATEGRTQLPPLRVDIERADPLELRMTCLMIGMNKAPENLFHSHISNYEMIGELNLHDDILVAQYSVWAICENENMGFGELRLPLHDIESQAANVRSWIYRLIARSEQVAATHHEYIALASEDKSIEARDGMAAALRNVYYDGLEEIVYDWHSEECEISIRDRLCEHMAANADKYDNYERPVLEYYSSGSPLLRARLEAAAERKPIYGKLRKLAYKMESATPDLFAHGGINMVQNINTGGGSIGAISNQGDIHAEKIIGSVTHNELQKMLDMVEYEIEKWQIDVGEREHAKQLIADARAAPGKNTAERLLTWLNGIKDGATFVDGAFHSISSVVDQVRQLIETFSI